VSRNTWFIAIAVLLFGCGPVPEIQERYDYWTHETSLYIRGEVTLNDLHSWLRGKEVYYTFDPSEIVEGNYTRILETIHPETFRCGDSIHIVLHVTLNNSQVIESFFVDLDGVCLW
jgi:hypothetical protein